MTVTPVRPAQVSLLTARQVPHYLHQQRRGGRVLVPMYTETPRVSVLGLSDSTHESSTQTTSVAGAQAETFTICLRPDGRRLTSRVRRSHDLRSMARTRPHTQRSVSNLHAGGHLMNRSRGSEDQKNLTTECVIVVRSTTGRRQTCRYRSYPDSDLR